MAKSTKKVSAKTATKSTPTPKSMPKMPMMKDMPSAFDMKTGVDIGKGKKVIPKATTKTLAKKKK